MWACRSALANGWGAGAQGRGADPAQRPRKEKNPGGSCLEKLRGRSQPWMNTTLIADLVNFLVYMGEPVKNFRVELGIYVVMFLGILFVLAYALKKEYWKDVH